MNSGRPKGPKSHNEKILEVAECICVRAQYVGGVFQRWFPLLLDSENFVFPHFCMVLKI